MWGLRGLSRLSDSESLTTGLENRSGIASVVAIGFGLCKSLFHMNSAPPFFVVRLPSQALHSTGEKRRPDFGPSQLFGTLDDFWGSSEGV